MSKGSQVITLRLSNAELFALWSGVSKSNVCRHGEPFTMSSWIRKAIAEKLQHQVRGGKKRNKGQEQCGTPMGG